MRWWVKERKVGFEESPPPSFLECCVWWSPVADCGHLTRYQKIAASVAQFVHEAQCSDCDADLVYGSDQCVDLLAEPAEEYCSDAAVSDCTELQLDAMGIMNPVSDCVVQSAHTMDVDENT